MMTALLTVRVGAARRAGARHPAGGRLQRLEGRGAAARQARAAREHALRTAAALRQRRGRRARPARRGQRRRLREAMNAEAARLGMGCTRYSSPSGFLDAGNFSCAADLARARPRRPAAAADRPRRPHLLRRTAVPDQGRQALPLQQQPAADLPLPRRHRAEDRLHRRRGQVPGGDRRTRTACASGSSCCSSDAPGTQARQLLDRGFKDVYHQKPVSEPPMPAGA